MCGWCRVLQVFFGTVDGSFASEVASIVVPTVPEVVSAPADTNSIKPEWIVHQYEVWSPLLSLCPHRASRLHVWSPLLSLCPIAPPGCLDVNPCLGLVCRVPQEMNNASEVVGFAIDILPLAGRDTARRIVLPVANTTLQITQATTTSSFTSALSIGGLRPFTQYQLKVGRGGPQHPSAAADVVRAALSPNRVANMLV